MRFGTFTHHPMSFCMFRVGTSHIFSMCLVNMCPIHNDTDVWTNIYRTNKVTERQSVLEEG